MSGDEVELLRSGIVYGTHQHGDAGTVTVDITDEGVAVHTDEGRHVFLDEDDVAAVIGYLREALRATTGGGA